MKALQVINIKVRPLIWYWKIFDILLIPFMWAGNGLKKPFQETHPWHVQKFRCDEIKDELGTKIVGDDKCSFSTNNPLFHMPALGGWKTYVILEARDFKRYWNVGWKFKWDNKPCDCKFNKLRIIESRVKLLKGPKDSSVIFFGLNENNKIIPLIVTDSGCIGDGRYPDVRLL